MDSESRQWRLLTVSHNPVRLASTVVKADENEYTFMNMSLAIDYQPLRLTATDADVDGRIKLMT